MNRSARATVTVPAAVAPALRPAGSIRAAKRALPGVASFGEAILRVTNSPPPGNLQFGRLTEPSLDLGGVVIVGITRRVAERYEASDTMVFYGSRVVTPGMAPARGVTANNFQFAIGLVFRL